MPLPLILAAVGGGLKALGKFGEGQVANATGKLNRKIADRNALGLERDAAAEEANTRAEVARTLGTQIAAQAEGGFQIGTGSSVDALMASQVEGMLEQLTIRRRAASQAQSVRFGGAMAQREGQLRAKAAYMGAAQDLVSTATDYAKYGAKGGR